jgi:glycosyltransferase 2 family protein
VLIETFVDQPPKRDWTNVARVVGLGLSVLILMWTFRDTEPARVAELLSRVGGAGLLILLPQLASLFIEAVGWRMAFQLMGRNLSLSGLFRARIATEALAQTLPMGVVLCESMKPVLLARGCGADLATSLAGIAARKWLLVASQSVYVGLFALLGWAALSQISADVLGGGALPLLLLGAAALLLLLATGGFALLSRGRVASRLHGALSRLPHPRLRAWLVPLSDRCAQADGQLVGFFDEILRSPLPGLAFLCGWLLEAVETILILHLLGVHLPWSTLGAVEVSASFLRSLAFVVPAGLGVQDLGYVTLLRGLGVSDVLNVAAAFLLLKRSKECFWAVVGYVVLAFELRPAPRPLQVEQAC